MSKMYTMIEFAGGGGQSLNSSLKGLTEIILKTPPIHKNIFLKTKNLMLL